MDAIKRDPDPITEGAFVAAISMTFPAYPGGEECQMTVEVTNDKVEYLARDLFGTRVQTTEGLRYVYDSKSGSKWVPCPNIALQGCQPSSICSTFGPEVFDAIQTSPTFQEETKQQRGNTNAVSMLFSHNGVEGAIIFLRLGLWQGTEIKKKLYYQAAQYTI